jgi:hypothetical protein
LYRSRFYRLLVFSPLILLLFISSPVSAESGLTVTVYNNFGYNNAPPLPNESGRPVVGTTTVSRVEQNFDQSPPFGMYEDFIVRYEGYITSPVSGSFRFWPQGDDGTRLYIDDVLVQDDWRDKGGGGTLSSYVDFEAGVSKKFEMWFYENGGGAWTTLYWDIGQGWEVVPDSAFTQQVAPTTTTTIAPYLNNPQNLVVTSTDETKVYLSWDAPEQSNADVERYAVFWSCDNWVSGYAIPSLTNFAIIENFEPEQSCLFKVRADNDSIPVYSGWSNEVNGITLPTTTTTTTLPEPEPVPTTIPVPPTFPPVDTEEPVETPPSQSDTEGDEPAASVPQYAEEQETPTEEEPVVSATEEAVAEIDTTEVSADDLANVVSEILSDIESPEELGSVVSAILDKPLTDEQFASVIDEVLSEPLSTEELSAVLNAVFDEPLSDEKFDSVIDAVLDQPLSDEQFTEVVGILESDTVTEEQVASAVDAVLELGITEDQATELATSEKVLQSIDGEQATEVFASIDIGEVTVEEAAEIVNAVQEAPTEVRDAFEEEINVFEGAVDSYVPLGSSVPVSTRRVIIGMSAVVLFSAPVPVSRR